MATDSTHLPQGETTLDASIDVTASDLDLTTVQMAQTEPANYVDLPKGNTVILLPVQPGQTVRLPTDSTNGLLAKIGPEGNLAIVVDGRTIILQGFLKANDQSPIKIVTNDGDEVNVADVVAATDPTLDIQTAAGPATGGQGDGTDGSGIYIPFLAGPGLGGIDAEGVLDPTALQYRLIDDERKLFTLDEGDGGVGDIDISFDVLGGIVNEDDLPADQGPIDRQFALKLVVKDGGNDGKGNDEFDDDATIDGPRNDKAGSDETDGVPDADREPLVTVATVKVGFAPGETPGALTIDTSLLPTNLTSEGGKIIYEEIPAGGGFGNQIIGFVDGGGDPAKFDHPDDRQVFSVKVGEESSDSIFTVTFELFDNIDNAAPDQDKDGQADLLGWVEDVLDLPIHMVAEDSNGSTKDATLPLAVQDDRPFFGEVVIVGDGIDIINTDASVTNDESLLPLEGDDQSVLDPDIQSLLSDLGTKVDDAGFSIPTLAESIGTLTAPNVAQKQVFASFGADGATVFNSDPTADTSIRNSVFGALQDRADGAIDDKVNGGDAAENEHPFELFMVSNGHAADLTEADLTIEDQETQNTVTWNGQEKTIFLRQIDAHTIVGYIEVDQNPTSEEAVLVINIDDDGVLTLVQLHQINNPIPGPGGGGEGDSHDEPVQLLGTDGTPLIYVRATDFDGDHAITPVNVTIEDDGPSFLHVIGTHNVDEDAISLSKGNPGGPGDDGVLVGKTAIGIVAFSIGEDRPGDIFIQDLTATDHNGNPVDLANLKTADDQPIVIDKSNPEAWIGYVDADGNGKFDGSDQIVFSFELNTAGEAIGAAGYKFTLYQPVEHSLEDDPGTGGTETSFEDDLHFDFVVRATDVDGDWADGTVEITIDDDSPKVTVKEGSLPLSVDETVAAKGTGDYDDPNNANGAKDGPRIEDDETSVTLPTALTDLGIVIGAAQANGSGAFNISPGADGLQSAVFGLTITDENTGLTDSQSGQPIVLVDLGGGIIAGQTVPGGDVVFALTIDPVTSQISMAQYRAVDHGPDSPARPDEVLQLGSGKLTVDVTVTDKDGDSVTSHKDLGSSIRFEDDGPKADIVTVSDNRVLHDETPGLQGDADDQAKVSLPPVFSSSGLIGWARSGEPVVSVADSEFGSDGAGTEVISLKVSAPDVDSGLDDTATGKNILLVQNGDIVEGYVEGTTDLAFAIAINPDGTLDVAQYRAIEHPDPNDNDEEIGIDNDALQAWVTVTDKDGDVATDSVAIGNRVQFDDDGPGANDDTDSITEDAVPNTAEGNVITGAGTTSGAAGADKISQDVDTSVTKITGDGGSDDVFDGGVLEVAGKYGTLKIDADGNYTYTLDNSNPEVNALNAGDKLVDQFTYVIKDGDKDPSDATLDITIDGNSDNKIPTAYDDKKCGDEGGARNANVMLIFDVSGSMNDPAGFGGLTKLQAAKQAAINMLNEYAASGGDVRVMLVWFNASADREEAWLSVSEAIIAINAIPASGDGALTDYQDAIAEAIQAFNDTDGRGDPTTHSGFVYLLSDGQPTTGGNGNNDGDGLPNFGVTPTTLNDWNTLLENDANNLDHVYAVGFGSGIPNGANNVHLQSVANPDNDAAPGDPNGTVLFVDDLADLSDTLADTVASHIQGNVIDGSIENDDPDAPTPGKGNDPDNVGDGFSHVSFFEYDHPTDDNLDIIVTWDGVGALAVDGTADGENVAVNGSKVSFDTEHGRMTFDLSTGDFDFAADAIDGHQEEHFTYKITDSNGDESNGADLTVCIKDVFVDDEPITYDDAVTGAEPSPQNANLLLVFDNSGSMDNPSGIPGKTKLQAAKEAAINLLNSYAATGGDVRVMLVTFNSNATRQETWLDVASAVAAINAIPQSGSTTDYQDAIAAAIAGFQDTDGRGDTTTHQGFVYYLSDGQPTTGGNGNNDGDGLPNFGITPATLTAWNNLLEDDANNVEHVYAVGFGSGIPNGANNVHLLSVANPDNDAAPGDPAGTVLFVDDVADLSATLEGTIGTEITGNILDGSIEDDGDAPGDNTPDHPGNGPAHLSYFEYDSVDDDLDIEITWDGIGAVVVDGVANGRATVINGNEVLFDTDHGRMTIDFTDGSFKLVAGNVSGGDKTEVFDYQITDVDGDFSNISQLKITIEDLPPVL